MEVRKFSLYEKKSDKPHFVFTVGSKAWLIPFLKPFESPGGGRTGTEDKVRLMSFLKPFETAKKRLAIEVAREDSARLRFASAKDLIETGEAVFNAESAGKIDFTARAGSDFLISGRFVFVLPSWGRRTKRRLWVIIKPRRQPAQGGKNDKAHCDVEAEKQQAQRPETEKHA